MQDVVQSYRAGTDHSALCFLWCCTAEEDRILTRSASVSSLITRSITHTWCNKISRTSPFPLVSNDNVHWKYPLNFRMLPLSMAMHSYIVLGIPAARLSSTVGSTLPHTVLTWSASSHRSIGRGCHEFTSSCTINQAFRLNWGLSCGRAVHTIGPEWGQVLPTPILGSFRCEQCCPDQHEDHLASDRSIIKLYIHQTFRSVPPHACKWQLKFRKKYAWVILLHPVPLCDSWYHTYVRNIHGNWIV